MSWSSLVLELERCADHGALRALVRRGRELGLPSGSAALRVALLGGASTDLLGDPLWLALGAAGFDVELHVAPYDSYASEFLDPASATSAFEPDVAVVHLTAADLPSRPASEATAEEADRLAAEVVAAFIGPCQALHERCGAEVVLNTLAPPARRPFGNLGARLPEDPGNFVRRVNLALGDAVPPCVHLHDVAALAERAGLETWCDERLWHAAKQAVAPDLLPEYVRDLAALIAATRGRARKCLVLDLDDTLWGGVVGEVGVAGLDLGQGTPRGEAFLEFQRYLKGLAARGVVLAVCSKNEEATALAPFAEHPECLLERDDFAAFRANWRPKSENVAEIADELGFREDALVFVDDNPAEREEVRRALPGVLVPEPQAATGDPGDLARALENARAFEPAFVTSEDRRRGSLYRQVAQARELAGRSTDLTDYLRSLEMRAVLRPPLPVELERVAQLVNRTNQVNLTGDRVTPGEVESLVSEGIAVVARLADRFGDHGLVSACLGSLDGEVLRIGTWVMSCRVLGRGLERAVLGELVTAARERGAAEIRGAFVETGRNEPARGHYAALGFELLGESEGRADWHLPLARHEPQEHFIEVDR